MTTFLMCEPTHFKVAYKINEWMNPYQWADEFHDKAVEQWNSLFNMVVKHGANVWLQHASDIWGEKGYECPDMVFTANHAFVLDGTALLAKFKHPERQGEEAYIRKVFQHLRDIRVLEKIEYPAWSFEGRGDCVYHNGRIYVSDLRRTVPDLALFHRLWPDYEVVALELGNPYFYHLDMCFCPLSNNALIYYPRAFNDADNRLIRSHFDHLIALDDEEAMSFAANCIEIIAENEAKTKTIIMPETDGNLRERLENIGYTVQMIDLSAFMRAGGAAACLVLRVN